MTPIYLIWWCGTKMAHYLEACVVFNKLIFQVHDKLFAVNICKEERYLLFTVENIDTLLSLNDLHEVFHISYLRKVDKSLQLVLKIYQTIPNLSHQLKHLRLIHSSTASSILMKKEICQKST